MEIENPTFKAMTKGIGILKLDEAISLGTTGPI